VKKMLRKPNSDQGQTGADSYLDRLVDRSDAAESKPAFIDLATSLSSSHGVGIGTATRLTLDYCRRRGLRLCMVKTTPLETACCLITLVSGILAIVSVANGNNRLMALCAVMMISCPAGYNLYSRQSGRGLAVLYLMLPFLGALIGSCLGAYIAVVVHKPILYFVDAGVWLGLGGAIVWGRAVSTENKQASPTLPDIGAWPPPPRLGRGRRRNMTATVAHAGFGRLRKGGRDRLANSASDDRLLPSTKDVACRPARRTP
jgi:hypothetical protein